LLCKHIIQCEIIKAPQAKHIVFLHNCCHRIDNALFNITSFIALYKKLIKFRTIL
jgi:hypothetical protein